MVTTITALFLKRGMGGCCDVDEGDRKRGIYRSKEMCVFNCGERLKSDFCAWEVVSPSGIYEPRLAE